MMHRSNISPLVIHMKSEMFALEGKAQHQKNIQDSTSLQNISDTNSNLLSNSFLPNIVDPGEELVQAVGVLM